MLLSHKIKMAAYYVKNKKCFRRRVGLSRHFDFLVQSDKTSVFELLKLIFGFLTPNFFFM
jgi:hypothetical protein